MKNIIRNSAFLFISIALVFTSCKRNAGTEAEHPAAGTGLNQVHPIDIQQDLLKSFLEKAEKNNKKLFLVFGAESCSWCRRLENYHKDATVGEILNRYFLIVNINIDESQVYMDLYKVYGKQGTPSWTIFDHDRSVMADSDRLKDGTGNVGYPFAPAEVEHYVLALKTAIPSITESELATLTNKLKEHGPVKSS